MTFKHWIIVVLLVTIVTSSFTLSTSVVTQPIERNVMLFRATGVVIMLMRSDQIGNCYLAGQIAYETPLYILKIVARGDFSINAPLIHKDIVQVSDSVYVNAFIGSAHCGAMRKLLQSDSVCVDVIFTVPNDTLWYKGRFYVPDSLRQKAEKFYK